MELVERYFLIVMGTFERKTIELDHSPTDEEIIHAITEENGKSAKIEKRFVLTTTKEANL